MNRMTQACENITFRFTFRSKSNIQRENFSLLLPHLLPTPRTSPLRIRYFCLFPLLPSVNEPYTLNCLVIKCELTAWNCPDQTGSLDAQTIGLLYVIYLFTLLPTAYGVWGRLMFSHVSVILFIPWGGGGLHGGEVCLRRGACMDRGSACSGVCIGGSVTALRAESASWGVSMDGVCMGAALGAGYLHGGGSARRVYAWRGVCMEGGSAYGKPADGTHPTGMRSCLAICIILKPLSLFLPIQTTYLKWWELYDWCSIYRASHALFCLRGTWLLFSLDQLLTKA